MSNKTFHVGISMAGAISAGAYTAGVMDYLLEALEHWQKAKDLQANGKLNGIPNHNIIIDVLSGASAGGMTAALTSALVHTDFEHLSKQDVDSNRDKLTQNPLYHSWVNLTEDGEHDMMSQMLATDDIEKSLKDNPNKEVRSVFNSSFIKTVAERHISELEKDPNVRRPYFAKDLEVVATLTNLRGIPFDVDFNNPSYARKHRMTRHFDLAHFKLAPDESYMGDGKIPLHFEDKKGCNKELLVQSAMATGGFPIGLEPRIIKRLGKYIKDNQYLNLGNHKDLYTVNPDEEFTTLNVDGGTINNDPFELTQNLLDDKQGLPHDQRRTKASDFNSTVLMIDPFPNHSDLPHTNYQPLKAFRFIIPKILSAMLGELRMKEDVLKSAYGSDDYTKFLIIPSRSAANRETENHIACGSLGGFGGFFSKDFRKHDFLLGRRNCQQFLRKHFSVPVSANNPILEYGYLSCADDYKTEIEAVDYLPLIPDLRVVHDEATDQYSVKLKADFTEDKTEFPEIKLSYLLGLKGKLKKRFAVLIKNITNRKDPDTEEKQNEIVKRIRKKAWYNKALSAGLFKPLTGVLIWFAKKKVKGILANEFIDVVIKDMDRNGLLVDDLK